MMPRALGAVLAGALLTSGLVAGTRVAWVVEPSDRAVVRLAWRSAVERALECREPSAAEQAALPAHMRQPRICEGRPLPLRLTVRIDGAELSDELLHAAGAQGDRPITVFRDYRVTPGAHRVEISFAVEGTTGGGPAGQPALHLDEAVELLPRQILLVTRAGDDVGGNLQIAAPPAP